jgi:hypothetical protein
MSQLDLHAHAEPAQQNPHTDPASAHEQQTHGEYPKLPGWTVQRHEDGTWTAKRRGSLTPVQREFGCALVVRASSLGELEVQAVAEGLKAAIVKAAEDLVDKTGEHPWRG